MGKEYRVFGPPGTGKTTYLIRQINRAIEKHGSSSVMVASFTKAAAQELVGRDLPLSDRQVGTLHSHCYRALDYPEVAQSRIKDFNEFAPEFQLTQEGTKDDMDEPGMKETTNTDGDKLYMKYQILRAKMLEKRVWPATVKSFARKWEKWKEKTGVIDFTDMIELAYREIEGPVGEPYIAFFDEAQDFTPLELALVRKWCESMEFIIICGDDDQNLYEFKGATPEAFLDPPLPEDNIHILNQSYRVPRKIQKLSQKWITKLQRRQEKEYKPKDEEGEVRKISAGNWKDPGAVFKDANKYLDKDKKVMFLVTCSYMLEPLKTLLREKGIPFHNPYRRKRGDWNPLFTGRGISSAERLLSFMKLSRKVWGEDASMWTANELKKWVEGLKASGNLHRGAKKEIRELTDDKLNTGNTPLTVDFLLDFFKEESLFKAMEMNLEWFENNLLKSRKKGMKFPLEIAKKRGAETLREEPKVIIGTIHSVKGGEADVVYLFPDLSLAGMREWQKTNTRDAIIRQFYVGMTRAKQSLIICDKASGYNVTLPEVG